MRCRFLTKGIWPCGAALVAAVGALGAGAAAAASPMAPSDVHRWDGQLCLLQLEASQLSNRSRARLLPFVPGGSSVGVTAALAYRLLGDKLQAALPKLWPANSSFSFQGFQRQTWAGDVRAPYDPIELETCLACTAAGHAWCVASQLEARAANEKLRGACAPSLKSSNTTQCLTMPGSCPMLRPSWVGSSAPGHDASPELFGATRLDAEGRPAWDSSPILDVDHKLIFCETPKVACTDFKRLFRRLSGHKDYESQESWIHDPSKNGITRLSSMTPDLARELMTDPSWTKALFVRDPMERLLSGYLDKCRTPVSARYDGHCPFDEEVSFEKFAKHIFSQGSSSKGLASLDEHWRPQYLNCNLEEWLPYYQFQGNFSHLREHSKYLLQSLGLFDTFGLGWGPDALELFETDADAHRTEASNVDICTKYYNQELASLALRFYRRDYDLLALPIPTWYWSLE